MTAALLLPAMVLAPLLVAGLVLCAGGRTLPWRLVPAAPLVALAAAVLVPEGAGLPMAAVVLGTTMELDGTARLFLGVSALAWALAGAHGAAAAPRPADAAAVRRTVFFLVTQAGSLGALAAAEPAAFYVFFAVMTVAAYGMIAADAAPYGRWAGRLYLAVALFGELLALAAFMLTTVGRAPEVAALLLLFGLGSKLGLLPLHVAQAPAYAAMPAAAAAVFAGPVLNTAVHGLLRFLPPGGEALPALAGPMVVLGLATAAAGGLLAAAQRDPRALLGYSTVSQMGLLTVGLAVVAAGPADPAAARAAVALFALHHAAVKAALVLATDAARRGGLVVAAALALSLAALPPTGGGLAKAWLEEEALTLAAPWAAPVAVGLPLASALTVLYMARLLHLLARPAAAPAGPALPFLALSAVALAGPWLLALAWPAAAAAPAAMAAHLGALLWPAALGGVLAAAAWRLGWPLPPVPPGDAAVPLARLLHRAARLRLPGPPSSRPLLARAWGRVDAAIAATERHLLTRQGMGAAVFVLLATLMVLAHA
ncbi:proton-conducting transporter transmembrane domain-containing protein [Azospirillum sp. ST 5-10]|uniref:proton-conducting transporter transmembrane domain-containing protein n=1 Tax=unclassified Azospirillum TaxID=2630922 RepID=UPI003F4A6826